MFGKQSQCTPGTTIRHKGKAKNMLLETDYLQPGDSVSIDQYQTPIPGQLPHTYGKEKHTNQCNGDTLFIDHASRFIATLSPGQFASW